MPPVVLLFLLAVVILAQLFHTLFPGRITYLRRVILAVIGVALGELAGRLLLPGPTLGELHAGWDIALTAALQLLGNRFLREPVP
ncbi:MAG: hypothetical protein M3010_02035 [Candidatus Dormibacteraeota bacterium]|nr:hypothetical protein [Candidatus Dormibacteraeota bacterium]